MIGIYKITNKINGKVYIGQSWDIEKRWANEKSGRTNNHLLKSFKKYGFENFHFEVLENLCENTPQEYLDIKEDFYILKTNSLDPNFGYNKNLNQYLCVETVKNLIYPRWSNDIFCNGKAGSFIYSDRDIWFFNSNLDLKQRYDQIVKHVVSYGRIKDKNIIPHSSKRYYLE